MILDNVLKEDEYHRVKMELRHGGAYFYLTSKKEIKEVEKIDTIYMKNNPNEIFVTFLGRTNYPYMFIYRFCANLYPFEEFIE